jgi:arsenate reductase (glutaredoxin)
METIIYHNPRCSKSRETLALLVARRIPHRIVDYLNNPPDRATLQTLLSALALPLREMVRRQESVYSELNLADAADDALLNAICAHPVLLERPIVVHGERARIGRPPANVLTLFADSSTL